MSRLKVISSVCAVIIAITAVVGIGARLDGRYARASTVSMVAEDLRVHKIEVRMKAIQERLWAMEDIWAERFKKAHGGLYRTLDELIQYMTPEARDRFRALQAEYEALEKELEDLHGSD